MLYDIFIGILVIVWISLTIARNIYGVMGRSWRVPDIMTLWLIPIWHFFAPNPGTTDYKVMVRDWAIGGTPGAWLEVVSASAQRNSKWTRILFWNPGKRLNKTLVDLAGHLKLTLQTYEPEELDAIQVSFPYLAILCHINRLPRSKLVEETQFMLLEKGGQAVPALILVSARHRVDIQTDA